MTASGAVAGTGAAFPLTRGFVGARALAMFERNVTVYRRSWLLLASGLAEPLLYLGSIGVGFGHLVGSVPTTHGPVSYASYAAPALLATSAMNGTLYDATFNVFGKLTYSKVYDSVLATPVGAREVAVGEVAWSLTRGLIYSVAFLAVMAGLGLVHSWWALLALPATVLVGLCFGGLGMAVTTYLRHWADFDYVQLAVLPLFLFSATFYPISTYPGWLQAVVRCTPLYNGIALLRPLTLGHPDLATLGHVGYLLALGAVGIAVTARRLERRLLH